MRRSDGFEEVPEEEIIKGYEHTKGHHVLIKPEELDELKLEAKHTIDMARFVDRDEIDSRYFEKPYYLLPDGDEADEGYTVLRDALAKTQEGRNRSAHHAWPRAPGRHHRSQEGTHAADPPLSRMSCESPRPYFDTIDTKVDDRRGQARGRI